jgi:putative FmdB family regulatory protein
MPVYEYECRGCGCRVDRLVPIDQRDEPVECEDCAGKMRRVCTAANFGRPKHRTRAILDGGRQLDGDWENPNG